MNNPVEHYVDINKEKISGIIKLKESFYEYSVDRYDTELDKKHLLFSTFMKLYPEIKRLHRYLGMYNGEYCYYFYVVYT